MALLRRGNRVYCYRPIRIDGRVMLEYRGAGPVAELAELRLQRQRADLEAARAALRSAERSLLDRLAALDAMVGDFCQVAAAAFRDAMQAAGWRLHNRGWRKGSMKPSQQAQKPARPAGIPLGHDIVFRVTQALIDRFAGDDIDAQLDAHRIMEATRVELSGAAPTPTERLLVERVVICHFNAYLADLEAERSIGLASASHLASLEKRRAGCHRRFLSAVKALEAVRKLVAPQFIRVSPTPRGRNGVVRNRISKSVEMN